MGEYACRVPGCEKSFGTAKGRAGHERFSHAVAPLNESVEIKKTGGNAVTQEKDTKDAIREVLADEKKAEAKAKAEESEKAGIAGALKGIGDRLDKMDTDFCSRFPELCEKVDKLEQAIPQTVAPGTEEWNKGRTAELDHALFGDCPDCGPVRDAVLAAKGKKLVDVEPEPEAKVEKPDAKVDEVEKPEAKVDEPKPTFEEVVTKVEEPTPTLDEPNKRTSPGYFEGSEWDPEKEMYVEQ